MKGATWAPCEVRQQKGSSALRSRELLEEAHDAFAEQQEQQDVGHGHQVEDAAVEAFADALFAAEDAAAGLAVGDHGLAHGTALRQKRLWPCNRYYEQQEYDGFGTHWKSNLGRE